MAREVEVDILEALKGAKVTVKFDAEGKPFVSTTAIVESIAGQARWLAAEAEEAKAEGPYWVSRVDKHPSGELDAYRIAGPGGHLVDDKFAEDGTAGWVAGILNSAHAAWLAQEPPKPWRVRVDSCPSGAGAAFFVFGPRVPEVTGRGYSTRKTAAEVADALNAAFAEGWQRKGGVVETMIGCNPNAAAILRGKGGAA